VRPPSGSPTPRRQAAGQMRPKAEVRQGVSEEPQGNLDRIARTRVAEAHAEAGND